jgi:hypothetical protein
LISLSKLKSIQATSRTKKGDSRFDPVYRGSRATLGVCRNRRMRFAVNKTVFTDELSERNTEIILCKHIFYSSFLQALPARLQLAVEVGLPNRHILIPTSRSSRLLPPPPDAQRMGTREESRTHRKFRRTRLRRRNCIDAVNATATYRKPSTGIFKARSQLVNEF